MYNPYTFIKMLEEKNDNLSVDENATDGKKTSKPKKAVVAENQLVEASDSEMDIVEVPIETEAVEAAETLIEEAIVEEVPIEVEAVEVTENLTEEAPIELEAVEASETIVEEAIVEVEAIEATETLAEEVPIELETVAKIENTEDAAISEEVPTEKKAKKSASKKEVVEMEESNTIELSEEEVANDSMVMEVDSDIAMNAIANANAEESEDETVKGRYDFPLQDYEALPMENLVEELEKLVAVEKVMSVREHVEEIKKAFFIC